MGTYSKCGLRGWLIREGPNRAATVTVFTILPVNMAVIHSQELTDSVHGLQCLIMFLF